MNIHNNLIIAEIGGNHDGDLEMALELIEGCAHAGADIAKFQLFNPETLYPGQFTPGAINPEWLPALRERADYEGIELLCSVFCLETLQQWLQTDPQGIKIASPESMNFELVKAAQASGLPVLIATGATTWGDLDLLEITANTALLHCVSSYPAPYEELNLRVIPHMLERYGCPVGFSDHSRHPFVAPVAASALGATIIEKHVSPDPTLPGPDHAHSIDLDDLNDMCGALRLTWMMLGDGIKRPMPSEDPTDRR
jgi:N-acetylneuraminate synthase/N,N'-diacetyllegionaminate synthase